MLLPMFREAPTPQFILILTCDRQKTSCWIELGDGNCLRKLDHPIASSQRPRFGHTLAGLLIHGDMPRLLFAYPCKSSQVGYMLIFGKFKEGYTRLDDVFISFFDKRTCLPIRTDIAEAGRSARCCQRTVRLQDEGRG